MYLGDDSDLLMALAGTSAIVVILDSKLYLVWASDSYFELFGLDRRSIGNSINDLALRVENLPFFQALEATSVDGVRRTVRNDSGDYGMIFDSVISRTGDHITIEVADVTAAVRAESQQRLLHSAQEAVIENMREQRHPATTGESVFEVGTLRLDLNTRTCSNEGIELRLTRIEFDLLSVLMRHPDRVITREILLAEVWGPWFGDEHLIESHISRMRKKIVSVGGVIVPTAVRGVGYKLDAAKNHTSR